MNTRGLFCSRSPVGNCPAKVGNCPAKKDGACRRTAGCLHLSAPHVFAYIFNPAPGAEVPVRTLRGDEDDSESLAPLRLGLAEGQKVIDLPLFGYRRWQGLVIHFWMIDADERSGGWAYVEQAPGWRKAYQIV